MTALAPAKVILSGEHAVVYGAPALAAAVNVCAHALPGNEMVAGSVALTLPDLGTHRSLSYTQLATLIRCCEERHQRYLKQNLDITEVVQHPADLLLAAVAYLVEYSKAELPDGGLSFVIRSDIPVGAGMGSSGATVVALLLAVAEQLEIDLSADVLRLLAQRCERLQHGCSSGLDPAVSVLGGILGFQQGDVSQLNVPLPGCWGLVQSGLPAVSTGTCVEQVRQQFSGSGIWSEFAAVTGQLETALRCGKEQAIGDLIRTNHRLLCDLGVVPASVQRYISAVEAAGGAAKISGAGAVRGEPGGLLLLYGPDRDLWPDLPAGYLFTDMELNQDGARLRG